MEVDDVATQDYQDYELKSFLDMLDEPSMLHFERDSEEDPVLLAHIWDTKEEALEEESLAEVVWKEFKAWHDIHITLPVKEECKATIKDGNVVTVRMFKPFAKPLSSEELPEFREFLNKIF